jgi:hypothetical protein
MVNWGPNYLRRAKPWKWQQKIIDVGVNTWVEVCFTKGEKAKLVYLRGYTWQSNMLIFSESDRMTSSQTAYLYAKTTRDTRVVGIGKVLTSVQAMVYRL